MLQAELHHRRHAVVEQAIADGKGSPLAHLPSGACYAGTMTATIRAYLVHVPPRLAYSARRVTLYLPQG